MLDRDLLLWREINWWLWKPIDYPPSPLARRPPRPRHPIGNSCGGPVVRRLDLRPTRFLSPDFSHVVRYGGVENKFGKTLRSTWKQPLQCPFHCHAGYRWGAWHIGRQAMQQGSHRLRLLYGKISDVKMALILRWQGPTSWHVTHKVCSTYLFLQGRSQTDQSLWNSSRRQS